MQETCGTLCCGCSRLSGRNHCREIGEYSLFIADFEPESSRRKTAV
ncbi:hypothetical protein [Treponema endosymbiont of Eucomonympha sp.]|nr:hypothetical protein [Treponema endosymbiont of Eucomonympha sp.]